MIDLGFVSLDVLIILIIVAILFFITSKIGKKPVATLIIAIFPSILILNYFPYLKTDDLTAQAIIFIVIYVLSYLVIQRNVHVKRNNSFGRRLLDSTLLTLSFVLLFLSTYIHAVPSLQTIYQFSSQILGLVSLVPYGLAMIIALIILIITNRRDYN